ncbi:MAG: phosphotriesterase [Bacteroidota bacterium]
MKVTYSFIVVLGALAFLSCKTEVKEEKDLSNYIQTVNGPISVDSMGVTLIHEHVFLDWSPEADYDPMKWNNEEAFHFILPYLKEMKAAGVKTFLECTPAYLGRNPKLLKRLSDETGLNILTNTGFYAARDYQHIPEFAYKISPEGLAQVWIKEFENGIEETGIKPGFIKIGLNYNKDSLASIEEKIVRAAAITHANTGLTIVAHSGKEHIANFCLEILQEQGVKPEAFVWTHAQNDSNEAHVNIARKGAWVSLDGMGSIKVDTASGDTLQLNRYVDYLVNLKSQNLLHRVLISHDSGWYTVGDENESMGRLFTPVFQYVIPELKRRGFTDQDIEQLLIINPQIAFAIGPDLND